MPPEAPDPTLESFFDQWVHDVGIPEFSFSQRVRGQAPRVRVTGLLSQSGVAEHFTTFVPVEFRFPSGRSTVRWLRSSSEPEAFDIVLPERPSKIVFNPGDSVLAMR
jgi:hypothetical protein